MSLRAITLFGLMTLLSLGIGSIAHCQPPSLGSKTPIIEYDGEVGVFLNQEKTDRVVVGMERAIKSVHEYEVVIEDYNQCQLDLLQSSYDKSLMRSELEAVKADNDSILSLNGDVRGLSEGIRDKVVKSENKRWVSRAWDSIREPLVIVGVAILSFRAGQVL